MDKRATGNSKADNFHFLKFNTANSLWYFLAAASYAFAASISFWKRPKYLYWPLTRMDAHHFLWPAWYETPLYFEEVFTAVFLLFLAF